MRLSAAGLLLAVPAVVAAGVFTVTADRASGVESDDGEMIVDLSGSVEVTDGEVTVTSDSGRVWQQSGRALFIGSVEVLADTLSATSDRLFYDREAGTVHLTGSVTLDDGGNRLTAGEVTWYRSAGKAIARDSVHMTGPWVGDVTGDYAMYDQDRGSIFVTSNPVLRRVEDGDSLVITADRLEFLPDSDRAEAQGNAVLDYPAQSVVATAEFLRFLGDRDIVELLGAPLVQSEDGELSGNWMEALLSGGEIERIRIEGAARGHVIDTSLDPPSETWFWSERAYFGFSAGEPDSVDLEGAVTLTYKAGGEGAAREESNTVSGRRLVVMYLDGSPETVTVTGPATGTYTYLEGGGR